jgi:hypothetical protein
VTLEDRSQSAWRWMSKYGPLDDVEPVLRRLLGERLAQ